jgi:hypothetical protein
MTTNTTTAPVRPGYAPTDRPVRIVPANSRREITGIITGWGQKWIDVETATGARRVASQGTKVYDDLGA